MNAYYGTRIVRDRKTGRQIAVKYVTDDGKAFHSHVKELVAYVHRARVFSRARLAVHVIVCPWREGDHDISNRVKILEDALQDAGLFADDEQIDRLLVERGPKVKNGGCVLVRVAEYTPDYAGVLSSFGVAIA